MTNNTQTKRLAIVSAIDITLKVLLLAQIKAAQKAGFEVHGICTKGPNFEMLQNLGVRMYPVLIKRSISPISDLAAVWKMYSYFRQERMDVVHTHTPKCSLLGQLAAKLAGVPVIVNTVHGFYFHENMKLLSRWFYVTMEWVAAKCSTRILSQNPEDVETAVKLGICKKGKIELLGNGVDLSKFAPKRFDERFKKEKRKEIGIPECAIIVGIIGRLVKEKGYLELFEAFCNIIKKHGNVWLVIIGPEETEKADRISADVFKQYGIESRTFYLGSRDDIPELLSCFDIYALPSWREGFPRSAIEAAAMSLPIVTTNIRGCRQVVEDGVNGILVQTMDSVGLEQALGRLIDDTKLRKDMGQAGYKKAQKEFDEQQVVKRLTRVYEELLKQKNINR